MDRPQCFICDEYDVGPATRKRFVKEEGYEHVFYTQHYIECQYCGYGWVDSTTSPKTEDSRRLAMAKAMGENNV